MLAVEQQRQWLKRYTLQLLSPCTQPWGNVVMEPTIQKSGAMTSFHREGEGASVPDQIASLQSLYRLHSRCSRRNSSSGLLPTRKVTWCGHICHAYDNGVSDCTVMLFCQSSKLKRGGSKESARDSKA